MNCTPLLSPVSPSGASEQGRENTAVKGTRKLFTLGERVRGIQGVKSDNLVFFVECCAADRWESFSYVCSATLGGVV